MAADLTVVAAEPYKAHALKLGGNFLITAMIQSLSEAFVYASSQDIDTTLFLETVNNALFQSPFYSNYGKDIDLAKTYTNEFVKAASPLT